MYCLLSLIIWDHFKELLNQVISIIQKVYNHSKVEEDIESEVTYWEEPRHDIG